MNQEIKELWIKALRSGKYKQTTGKLKSIEGSYCCLGVLCDLYTEKTGIGKWKENTYHTRFDFDDNNCNVEGLLPKNVMLWANLDHSDPILKNGRYISFINDRGATFEEISNFIETDL